MLKQIRNGLVMGGLVLLAFSGYAYVKESRSNAAYYAEKEGLEAAKKGWPVTMCPQDSRRDAWLKGYNAR